ncbi:peptidylprolyl isomerase [Candidatus Pelagibacter sp.]|jgi:peptidyl-prolyl cis-trans isomerase SurA|nr:peptidylprolyl isomerase [Candidatus Pelagibacter sp.]
MIHLKFIGIIFFLLFFLISKSFSLENKILFKINNEIITSIDIEEEYRYLIALNDNLKKLSQNEIIEIAKKSIIKEKIKTIEINKNFKNPKIPDEILKQILKNLYTRLNINNLDDFKKYLISNNVKYQGVKNKIEIESLWNELIIAKFSSKIQINENEIRNNLIKNQEKFSKSYLLSEIFFEISNSSQLNKKYQEIIEIIQKKGFENAAASISTSNTANQGGKIGWIDEDTLNENLKKILSELNVNEITKPLTMPGGFMILKINEIKKKEKKQNIENELKRIINFKKNDQLNQFSKIYFNKVKINIKIHEI